MIIRFGLPQRFIVKAHHHSDPIRACFRGGSYLNNRKLSDVPVGKTALLEAFRAKHTSKITATKKIYCVS